ncbi:MAG: TonB-dependent receptor, partial [Oceanospirillum sp.]|nr:TonB-dependent receptor [Oceanospirillum sp.]
DTDCGGQDVQATPSYWVANLDAQYHLQENLTLDAGINNLLDKAYSLHESRGDANSELTQVAEPGRSLWVKAHYRF